VDCRDRSEVEKVHRGNLEIGGQVDRLIDNHMNNVNNAAGVGAQRMEISICRPGSCFRRRDGSTRPAADAMASAAFGDSGSVARLRTQAAPRTGRL
jgi:hypothetical protein